MQSLEERNTVKIGLQNNLQDNLFARLDLNLKHFAQILDETGSKKDGLTKNFHGIYLEMLDRH
jgi:hypothetical protein